MASNELNREEKSKRNWRRAALVAGAMAVGAFVL